LGTDSNKPIQVFKLRLWGAVEVEVYRSPHFGTPAQPLGEITVENQLAPKMLTTPPSQNPTSRASAEHCEPVLADDSWQLLGNRINTSRTRSRARNTEEVTRELSEQSLETKL